MSTHELRVARVHKRDQVVELVILYARRPTVGRFLGRVGRVVGAIAYAAYRDESTVVRGAIVEIPGRNWRGERY